MGFENIPGEIRAKKIISGALKTGRIANSYIFCGQNVDQIAEFTKEFAKLLNCETACGKCLNCTKITSGTHPDFIVVMPEGKKSIIKIDRIRDLKNRIKIGPAEGTYLVVSIMNADSIEIEAANSLLKMLEEPPQGVVFVLITSRMDSLPKTVVSRCQGVIFANQNDVEDIDAELPSGSDVWSLLKFSSSLSESSSKEAERDKLEKKLRILSAEFFRARKLRESRIVLNAIRDIKKMANTRLLMDRMSLCLGGWIDG